VAAAALARDEPGLSPPRQYADATLAPARSIVIRLADDDSAQVDALAAVC
jgi:hypothetical protein